MKTCRLKLEEERQSGSGRTKKHAAGSQHCSTYLCTLPYRLFRYAGDITVLVTDRSAAEAWYGGRPKPMLKRARLFDSTRVYNWQKPLVEIMTDTL